MYHPQRTVIAGALFAAAWSIFIDAVIVANQDPDPYYHTTFVAWVPGLLALVGFAVSALTTAETMSLRSMHDQYLTAVVTTVGWAASFAASCMAVLLLVLRYGPHSSKEPGFVGVAMVTQTNLLALSAILLWARRAPSSAPLF